MIHTTTGSAVGNLVERLIAHPERFAEVLLCTPFVDDEMVARLVRFMRLARRARLATTIITSPSGAATLRAALGGHPASWRRTVTARERLHAKVYLVLGKRGALSEVIITSANLTRAGVSENIELGIHAVSSSESGRQLISEVHTFVRRIAA